MQLPYIKQIHLTKNYTYLTDKLMGIKILEEDRLSLKIDDSIAYKVAYIGKSKPEKKDIMNNGSYFATNKIVRIGNAPIHAFANQSTHSFIYMTDLFMVTRSPSNIYNKDCAFYSAIIDKKDENNINHKYNLLHRSIGDLPF